MTKTRITYPVLTDPRAWESAIGDYTLTDFGSVKTPVGIYKIYAGDLTTDVLLNGEKFVSVIHNANDDILEFLRKQAHRDMLERLGEKVDPIDNESFVVARWDIE